MGLLHGCKLCNQVLLEVPQDIPSLESYLGDGEAQSIASLRHTCFGQKDEEEKKVSGASHDSKKKIKLGRITEDLSIE
jgi:hypothetical protein